MSKRRKSYVVTLTVPEGATQREVMAYIRDAVSSMKGCFPWANATNPLSALNGDTVRVRTMAAAASAPVKDPAR